MGERNGVYISVDFTVIGIALCIFAFGYILSVGGDGIENVENCMDLIEERNITNWIIEDGQCKYYSDALFYSGRDMVEG